MLDLLPQLLLLAFCNSLMIIGIWESATWKLNNQGKWRSDQNLPLQENDFEFKMVFWKVSYLSKKYIGEFWSKPIITCSVCMSSLHSTYVYWTAFYLFMPHDYLHTFAYLFYVPLLAGVTTVIVNVIYRD